MTLLAPGLALAGLLAAAVPIVIHLLLKRRRTPVPWAAMNLLLEAVRRHRRRSRIERILLLVVRALLLAALGLALASPLIGERSTLITSRTVHLVIDDGITSAAIDAEGTTALARNVAKASALVQALDGSDRVSITLAGRPVRTVVDSPTTDHRSIIDVLESLPSREGATDLSSALERAAEETEDRDPAARTEIHVFSDFRRGAIDDRARIPVLVDEDSNLRLFATAPADREVGSVQVVDIGTARVPLSLAGGSNDRLVTVRLRRTGFLPAATTVVSLGGDAIAATETRQVDWRPGVDEASVDFQVRVDEDGGVLEASILESDDLPLDDRRSTMIPGRIPSRVLVVDRSEFGSIGAVDRWRASDWFERAMLPDPESGVADAIEIDRVDPAALDRRDLEGASVLAIARPDLVDESFLPVIGDWARAGGVLVIMPPGEVTTRPWATPLLESIGIDWSVALEPVALDPPRRLAADQPKAPLTRLLDAEIPDLTPGVSIQRMLPLQGPSEGDVALIDDQGDPFLVDVGVGLGRLVFFTVAPELSWTDLPVRPLMVPLIQEIGRQGAALVDRDRDGIVGERLPSTRLSGAAMVLPGGVRVVESEDSGDEPDLRLPERSGIAEVVDIADRTLERRAVNPAVARARLETIDRSELLEWISPAGDWTFESDEREVEGAGSRGEDLARPLIMLVLLLALVETALARWFTRGGSTTRRAEGLTGANADADAARTHRVEGTA